MGILNFINQTFKFKVGSMNIAPTYWQAATIVFLLFLLVFTLARLRWLYVHWSMGKGSFAMITWGFVLALVVEGFLMISGRTLFTELLGWKNAPKPISTVLNIGRDKLVDVLGTQDEIPSSFAGEKGSDGVVSVYQSLSSSEAEKVKQVICTP